MVIKEVVIYYCTRKECTTTHAVERGDNHTNSKYYCPFDPEKKTNLKRKCTDCHSLVSRQSNSATHTNCSICKRVRKEHPNPTCKEWQQCTSVNFEKASVVTHTQGSPYTINNSESIRAHVPNATNSTTQAGAAPVIAPSVYYQVVVQCNPVVSEPEIQQRKIRAQEGYEEDLVKIIVDIQNPISISPLRVRVLNNWKVSFGNLVADVLGVYDGKKGGIFISSEAPEGYPPETRVDVRMEFGREGSRVNVPVLDDEDNHFTYKAPKQKQPKQKQPICQPVQVVRPTPTPEFGGEFLNFDASDIFAAISKESVPNQFEYEFQQDLENALDELNDTKAALVRTVKHWKPKRDIFGRSLLFYVDSRDSASSTPFHNFYKLLLAVGYDDNLKDNFGITSGEWKIFTRKWLRAKELKLEEEEQVQEIDAQQAMRPKQYSPVILKEVEQFGMEMMSLIHKYDHSLVMKLGQQIYTKTLFDDNLQKHVSTLLANILRYDVYATAKHGNIAHFYPKFANLQQVPVHRQQIFITRNAAIQPQPLHWYDARWSLEVVTSNNKLGFFVRSMEEQKFEIEKRIKVTVRVGTVGKKILVKTWEEGKGFGWPDLLDDLPDFKNLTAADLFLPQHNVAQNNHIVLDVMMEAIQEVKSALNQELMKEVSYEVMNIHSYSCKANHEANRDQENRIQMLEAELKKEKRKWERELVLKQQQEARRVSLEHDVQDLMKQNQELKQELAQKQETVTDDTLRLRLKSMEEEYTKLLSGNYGYELVSKPVPGHQSRVLTQPTRAPNAPEILTPPQSVLHMALPQVLTPKRKIEAVSPNDSASKRVKLQHTPNHGPNK